MNVWELFNSIRKGNIGTVGIQEGEEKEKGAESLFKEMIAENFPGEGIGYTIQQS